MRETRSRRFSCMVRMASVRSSISSWPRARCSSESTLCERSPRLISTAEALSRPTRETRAMATVSAVAEGEREPDDDGAGDERVRHPGEDGGHGEEQHHAEDDVGDEDLGLQRDGRGAAAAAGRPRGASAGAAAQGDEVRRAVLPARRGPRGRPFVTDALGHREPRSRGRHRILRPPGPEVKARCPRARRRKWSCPSRRTGRTPPPQRTTWTPPSRARTLPTTASGVRARRAAWSAPRGRAGPGPPARSS